MNTITQQITSVGTAKPIKVSAVSPQVESEKSGNNLPQLDQTAKVEHADPQVSQEHVEAAVAQMNKFIQSTQRDLHFSYDKEAGEAVVKVVDRETQEVIRQIPNETFLQLARDKELSGGLHFLNAQA